MWHIQVVGTSTIQMHILLINKLHIYRPYIGFFEKAKIFEYLTSRTQKGDIFVLLLYSSCLYQPSKT